MGIAIGSGTDIAIQSGEIVLVKHDLLDAGAALELSKKVMAGSRNIFWALLTMRRSSQWARIIYPFFGFVFRPELASLPWQQIQ